MPLTPILLLQNQLAMMRVLRSLLCQLPDNQSNGVALDCLDRQIEETDRDLKSHYTEPTPLYPPDQLCEDCPTTRKCSYNGCTRVKENGL